MQREGVPLPPAPWVVPRPAVQAPHHMRLVVSARVVAPLGVHVPARRPLRAPVMLAAAPAPAHAAPLPVAAAPKVRLRLQEGHARPRRVLREVVVAAPHAPLAPLRVEVGDPRREEQVVPWFAAPRVGRLPHEWLHRVRRALPTVGAEVRATNEDVTLLTQPERGAQWKLEVFEEGCEAHYSW